MYYIKIDEDKKPVGYPILTANLQQVLEVSCIDQEILDKFGYVKFEQTAIPTGNVHVEDTHDYYLDADGIARNRLSVREFTQDELIEVHIRNRRSFLLVKSDWTQSADAPLTAEKKAEWAEYRQKLRDLPSEFPDVKTDADVEWPVEPT
jgi:hypothetical protein